MLELCFLEWQCRLALGFINGICCVATANPTQETILSLGAIDFYGNNALAFEEPFLPPSIYFEDFLEEESLAELKQLEGSE